MAAEVKVTETYMAAESKMIGKCMATEAETMFVTLQSNPPPPPLE